VGKLAPAIRVAAVVSDDERDLRSLPGRIGLFDRKTGAVDDRVAKDRGRAGLRHR
jgi:hypothetical protein